MKSQPQELPLLNYAAVSHEPGPENRFCLPDGRVLIRMKAMRDDADRVDLLYADIYEWKPFLQKAKRLQMLKAPLSAHQEGYEACFTPGDRRVHYLFRLEKDGKSVYYDGEGFKGEEALSDPQGASPFPFAYAYPSPKKPAWAVGSVGYQIFPERFRRSDTDEWPKLPVRNESFFGGSLKGIRRSIPYLKTLGVDFLYLNPIFLSNSAHRYNCFDYYQIDPLLGNADDLKALSRELHQNGMRLILDGVFNHAGERFPPFLNALEKGPQSPYYDWFCFDPAKPSGYECFAYEKRMPKLNLKNLEACEYFINVARYWTKEAEIDGWRLDVSSEVWPDFWRRFRQELLKIKPDALLVAECWDDAREWVNDGDMFDSTMNYLWSKAVWDFTVAGNFTSSDFGLRLNRLSRLYPPEALKVMWNLIDSHDTPRFLNRAQGDRTALKAAVFLQMTSPGIPVLYYGDELGMEGGQDPDCRRPMEWDRVKSNPVFGYYRELIRLRHGITALREGDFQLLQTFDGGLAYLRRHEKGDALCILSLKTQKLKLQTPYSASQLREAVSGADYPLKDGFIQVNLTAGEGLILLPAHNA